ncbi:hypothetical protein [Yoonia sp. MH D7]
MIGTLGHSEGSGEFNIDIDGNFMGTNASGLLAGGTGTAVYDDGDEDQVGVIFAVD